MNRRPISRAALLAAVAIAATGCSATQGADADTYLIMALGPLTPSQTLPTPFPEIAVGAKAGADVVNAAGGVNGKRIEIIECDTKADPNEATTCAQEAVEKGVVAVVGAFDIRGDYLAVLEAGEVPAIAPWTRSAEATSPVAFPVNGGQFSVGAGEVRLLADRGARTISHLTPAAGSGGQDISALWKPVLASTPGLSVKVVDVPTNAADLAAVATSASRSEGVSTALQGAQLVPALTTLRQIAPELPVAADSISLNQKVIDQLGDIADGIYSPGLFLPPATVGNPAVDKLNAAWNKVGKDVPKSDFGMNAYAGVTVFAEVMKGAAEVTGPATLKALRAAKNVDIGLMPPVDFTTPSDAMPGLTRLFNTSVVFMRVEDGRFQAIDGKFVDVYTGATAA